MKILIAPDSFKGSLTSVEASRVINQAILDMDPTIETVQIPMADGGEGTVAAVLWNQDGKQVSCRVHDPLGREIEAMYGWMEHEKTAIIEMAAASGLPLLDPAELDPQKASSYGTGELIKDALDKGAETIILGLGGSATVDAGSGLFQALGVRFLGADLNEISWIGGLLDRISAMDLSGLDRRLTAVRFIVAGDVTNPLLGKEGAIAVFGPQKGVGKDKLAFFEQGMRHFSELAAQETGRAMADAPGSGAAGGAGFLLRTILEVDFRSGLELMVELAGLEEQLEATDLILTAEGRIDGQTFFGKVPVGIGRIAKKQGVPVIAFAGSLGPGTEKLEEAGIGAVMPIAEGPLSLSDAMKNSGDLLYNATTRLMKILEIGRGI
ncbi:glycerate kinase [Planococcus salinarum]|uniref:glycerate kinase n=1 Tax=Planococcus salinarum TaxID=622695 RepID=UPI000E3D7760|nr:glycerate kinase [Planococcus salinarum]TAA72719.1 glycerate kinase [Planococcus salinarum]